MSLVITALRRSLVLSLRGRTPAGLNVADSALTPVDERAAQFRPVIAVFTEDFTFREGAPVAYLQNRGKLTTTVEMMISSRNRAPIDQSDPNSPMVDVDLPMITDPRLEAMVDEMVYKCQAALADPDNEWAEFFKSFAAMHKITRIDRGSNARDGLKLAAAKIVFEIEPIPDLAPGSELTPLWADFLEALEGTPDERPWAGIFASALAGVPTDYSRQLAAIYGYSEPERDALMSGEPPEAA